MESIQTIDLNEFGFKLHFPRNASLEPVTFTIGVTLSQNLIPPPNTTLVSALYYIKTSSQLLQPVTIEIEHCIKSDSVDSAKLTFAKADTDSSLPHVFEKLSGGRFRGISWGTINLSIFSEVGVFAESVNDVNYFARIFTSRRKGAPGIYRYRVDLVISRKLSAIKEVLIMMGACLALD